jgi:protease-4
MFGGRRGGHDFVDLLTLLRAARSDPCLQGVFIRCSHLRAGWAQIQELRRCLVGLRDAGKKVWVFLAAGGIHEYVLASAAERIVLPPAATLDITGLSSEVVFWTGALQKLGIEAELVQLGKFKSAGEAFTRTDMSAPHREMIESLIDDLYAQVVERVAQGRRVSEEQIRTIVDGGPFLASEALDHGLVDALAYEDEAEEELRRLCGDFKPISADDYARRRERAARREVARQGKSSLALVHLNGTIKTGDSIAGPVANASTRDEDGARTRRHRCRRVARFEPGRLWLRIRPDLARGGADARRQTGCRLVRRRRRVGRLLRRRRRPPCAR